ncbi:MAG: HAD hydrolase-like protein [Clostridiales bacterium]|nr:HAD hydrolase-like protein [Clostridiales bacterium]
MEYDLLLFDMDGTLVDSKEGIIDSVMYALGCFGFGVEDGFNFDDLLGPPIREGFHMLGDFADEQVEGLVAKYREDFTARGMFEARLYPGIEAMLAEFKARGANMAVATSKVTIYAEKILSHFGIAHYFDIIAGANLDGSRSEKPEIIAHVLDSLDKDRKLKVAMIGDRKYDILGAKAHNITSVGCLWGYGGQAELENAGACFLVDSPKDLLKMLKMG